jgi:hypothetical protein
VLQLCLVMMILGACGFIVGQRPSRSDPPVRLVGVLILYSLPVILAVCVQLRDDWMARLRGWFDPKGVPKFYIDEEKGIIRGRTLNTRDTTRRLTRLCKPFATRSTTISNSVRGSLETWVIWTQFLEITTICGGGSHSTNKGGAQS